MTIARDNPPVAATSAATQNRELLTSVRWARRQASPRFLQVSNSASSGKTDVQTRENQRTGSIDMAPVSQPSLRFPLPKEVTSPPLSERVPRVTSILWVA